jgi:hypothetical protein
VLEFASTQGCLVCEEKEDISLGVFIARCICLTIVEFMVMRIVPKELVRTVYYKR